MSKDYGYRWSDLYNYLLLVYVFAVGFLILFGWPLIGDAFGVNRQMAFFPAVRVFMTVSLTIILIPGSFV
ncbi:MAG: hypothetical protein WCD81_03960 [Candidatus Bathyarchaeia archaeon]